MKVGGLYWVNVPTFGCTPSCVGFGTSHSDVFQINNGHPIIILEIIHEGKDVYLFRCLTHKGIGERSANAVAFESWFKPKRL